MINTRNASYIKEFSKIVIKDKSTIVRDIIVEKIQNNIRKVDYEEAKLAFRALKVGDLSLEEIQTIESKLIEEI